MDAGFLPEKTFRRPSRFTVLRASVSAPSSFDGRPLRGLLRMRAIYYQLGSLMVSSRRRRRPSNHKAVLTNPWPP